MCYDFQSLSKIIEPTFFYDNLRYLLGIFIDRAPVNPNIPHSIKHEEKFNRLLHFGVPVKYLITEVPNSWIVQRGTLK